MKAEITNIVKRNDTEITVFYKIVEENGHIIEENAHLSNTATANDILATVNNRLEQIKSKPEINYEELIGEVVE
jgi:hypothetical protein